MQFKDYYAILGVEPSAGDAEIKTAYRRLARKYHPDVSKEAGAEDKFKSVNEAYEALRDPERRKAYDQLRSRGYRPGDDIQPPSLASAATLRQGFDYDEVFGSGAVQRRFSDDSRKPVPGQAQQRGGPGSGRPPGSTARAAGAPVKPSPGRRDAHRVWPHARVNVRAGPPARDRWRTGVSRPTLLLESRYAAPRFVSRPHHPVRLRRPLEAALAPRDVPTLGGTVELKVPAGSEAGRRLRLRGRGLPGSGGQVDGAQIAELEVQAPAPRDEEQKAAYEALRDAFSGDSRRD